MIPCVTGYINKVIMAGQGVSTGPQQEGNSPVRLLFHRTDQKIGSKSGEEVY